MTFCRFILALLLLLPVVARAISDDEVLPSDPRMIEANALLEGKETWGRAIELYTSVLEEQPDHVMARTWLARVQAWNGDYDPSLANYDVLLAMDPPPAGMRVERAEVLSWAGRYGEAEAAFQAILLEDPHHFEALRGLARVYNWSGRGLLAEETYTRALEAQDDLEVRKERKELRAQLSWDVDARMRSFTDSDDFYLNALTLEAAGDLSFVTRAFARS